VNKLVYIHGNKNVYHHYQMVIKHAIRLIIEALRMEFHGWTAGTPDIHAAKKSR